MPLFEQREEKIKTTSTSPESSSSLLTKGENINGKSEVVDCLVASASRMFADVTDGKIAAAIGMHGLEWVRRAVGIAEQRRPAPKGWGFVIATLENFEREGGPGPNAPVPAVRPVATPAPTPAPAPVIAEDFLDDLFALCRLTGTTGEHARRTLRRGLDRDEITVDRVPSDILAAGMGNRLRDVSPNIPPQPAGASSCHAPPSVRDIPNAAKNNGTPSGTGSRRQCARQDSNLQPSDSKTSPRNPSNQHLQALESEAPDGRSVAENRNKAQTLDPSLVRIVGFSQDPPQSTTQPPGRNHDE